MLLFKVTSAGYITVVGDCQYKQWTFDLLLQHSLPDNKISTKNILYYQLEHSMDALIQSDLQLAGREVQNLT